MLEVGTEMFSISTEINAGILARVDVVPLPLYSPFM